MKTKEVNQEGFIADYIFTTKEFEELMNNDDGDSEIEFVDSFGYFYDGQNITNISIDPYTFDDYKDLYPYVIWRKL